MSFSSDKYWEILPEATINPGMPAVVFGREYYLIELYKWRFRKHSFSQLIGLPLWSTTGGWILTNF